MSDFGIGGSSAKTDRGNTLTGYKDLSSIFDFGTKTAGADTGTGTATTATGTNALGTALSYFRNLLSGGRTTALQAIAPYTDAARSQADAQRREIAAAGTSRGGGTAGVEQQVQDKTNAAANDALLQARSGAAGGVATIGNDLARTGLGEQGLGLEAENTASRAAGDLTDESRRSRTDSYDINHKAQQTVANTVESILSAFV